MSNDHNHGGNAKLKEQDSAGGFVDASHSDNASSGKAKGSSIHNDDVSKALDSIDNGDGTFTHTHADGTVESHPLNEKGSGSDKNAHKNGKDGGGDTSHDHAATGDTSGGHVHTASENPLPKAGDDYKQQNGTTGSDKITGGKGDDFIFPGEGAFKFNSAETKSGAEEFPFPNTSSGSSTADLSLDDKGNFKVGGSFKDFNAAPLFSQGEKEIDPKAEILNGSDPKALVDGFLAVPKDVEGNNLSGTHLHFSPSGDDRGNFADATVVRFLDNTANKDGTSGSVNGDFKLKPEEQAALLAGNLYANIHTNVDVDGDGKAGFPTGENRLNFNEKVVQFT